MKEFLIDPLKQMMKGETAARAHKDVDKDRELTKLKLEQLEHEINPINDYFKKQYVKEKILTTTNSGCPVDSDINSLTAGERGPILLQDTYLIEKLQNFTRERIPERVVHARGTGAYGYLEITDDITNYCKAKVFTKVGEKIPLFARFSLVIGLRAEPETTRDIRGFALKMYTEEGNWDLLCNNLPVFPIRDAMRMSDMVHAMKRHPQTNLYDPDAYWDFFSQTPESLHCITMMYSDKGMTDGYRQMHGFANHTFRMVNSKNEVVLVKFHLISDQGLKGLTLDEAVKLAGEDPDYYTRDLYDNISKENYPSWTFYIQAMPEKNALTYKYDVLDVTQVWPHKDFPLIKIGKVVLNKLPNNFFVESEQAAFNPANLIPGIEPTPDKLLQSRLFAYRDAQLHRLGTPNYQLLPVNCPFNAKVANVNRDGQFCISAGGTGFPNYEPSSFGGPLADPSYRLQSLQLAGSLGRFDYRHPTSNDFEQCNYFYANVLSEKERANLVKNICNFLRHAKKEIQERQCRLFYKVNEDYGLRVAANLGMEGLFESGSS